MVWQRIPKEIYVGRETLELGLYDAVSYFNIGSMSIIKLFQALGIPSGKYTEEGCRLQDQLRVNIAQHKSKATTKKRRKVIRGLKKISKLKESAMVLVSFEQFNSWKLCLNLEKISLKL